MKKSNSKDIQKSIGNPKAYKMSKYLKQVNIKLKGGRDLDFYLLYKSVTKRGGA